MWKKTETTTPAAPAAPVTTTPPAPTGTTGTTAAAPAPAPVAPVTPMRERESARGPLVIGQTVVIKGEVSAREDIVVAGRVEGKILVAEHTVRVGREAHVAAEIHAKAVVIEGRVTGNVSASDRVEILPEGRVDGDLTSPKVAMADGAEFRGKIDMTRKSQAERKSA